MSQKSSNTAKEGNFQTLFQIVAYFLQSVRIFDDLL